mgnify:CR=1 FL=1
MRILAPALLLLFVIECEAKNFASLFEKVDPAVVQIFATDLDADGDADVLSASQADDKIAWYENLGGGSFGPQQVITTDADGALSVYATDLDGDGDAFLVLNRPALEV